MSNDLVKRLRDHIAVVVDNRGHVFEDEALCDDAADRIEDLEAQVRAADALAEAFEDFNGKIDKARAPVGPARIAAIEALAAYRATKEGGE